ncbi:hypothetical protein ACPPVU_23040 [Mucilaginibacter sp. McL0603]|uniref:hypothetical protein n=1 Tax=Mucilaginibacter sp. McL0603 TaxID=3415670 RepID=UPI003CF7588D
MLHITKDIKDREKGDGSGRLGFIGIFKHGMKYCPPGFTKRYFILETVNNYKAKMNDEAHFTVSYKDAFKSPIKESFSIAVNEMSNWSTITPSPTHIGRIAESLQEISKSLKKG